MTFYAIDRSLKRCRASWSSTWRNRKRSFSLSRCKKDDGKKGPFVSLLRNWFLVHDHVTTGTSGYTRMCALSYDTRGYHSRPRSTATSGRFSSRRASSRCTITVFPRILITRRMRREKPSRASRKHAEVDESRLNPSIRGGLLLRLTLSLLPLANVAAIFKRP